MSRETLREEPIGAPSGSSDVKARWSILGD